MIADHRHNRLNWKISESFKIKLKHKTGDVLHAVIIFLIFFFLHGSKVHGVGKNQTAEAKTLTHSRW